MELSHFPEETRIALGIIRDHADPTIVGEWAEDLRANADKQTSGVYQSEGCFCVLGRLLALRGHFDDTPRNDAAWLTLLGATSFPDNVPSDTFFWGITSLNDRGPNNLNLPFPEIADILEGAIQ